jgi:transposase
VKVRTILTGEPRLVSRNRRWMQHDPLLAERVERLMSIPAVGPITALTWALEVGDVQRLGKRSCFDIEFVFP